MNSTPRFLGRLLKFKRSDSGKETLLYALTPRVITEKDDLDRIQPYLDSLKRAVQSENVANIALMGGYGSGKSTVLMTFRSIENQLKYLNVSLANFISRSGTIPEMKDWPVGYVKANPKSPELKSKIDEGRKNDDINALHSREETERLIELSVLQQLIFQINSREISESRFKRIRHVTTWRAIITSFLFLLWCFSIVNLVAFADLSTLNVTTWKWNYSFEKLIIAELLIGFFGFVFFLKASLKFLANSRIVKVSIKGEIELGQSGSDSIFNKYIEEIVYFFQRVNVDVVFFEDLDRFPDSQIFSKLREINTIINHSRNNKKSVTFVYAVGDAVFKDKSERVKFFDYIIPITPYLSSNNASDVFARMLEGAGIRDLITNDFLLDVFTFVSDIDMRLLQNTFNEFVINSKLLPEGLNPEYLFSILLYKNVYPEDYSDLMVGRGNLFGFFESKSSFISELRLKIDNRIEEVRKLQSEAVCQHLNNLNELKSLYLFEILKSHEGLSVFIFENDECTIENAIEDRFFERIASDENWRYKTTGGYRALNRTVDFNQIQSRVSTHQTYEDRKKYYVETKEAYLLDMSRELKSLEEEIRDLRSKSVADLISLGDFEGEFEVFGDRGLVRYLITNGKIDEHYHDYIFRVYEDNLPMSDFEFERNVKSAKPSDFYQLLSRPDVLLKRIPNDYFNRSSVLNFSLLEYLLTHEDQYELQLANFFSLIAKPGKIQAKFINELVRGNYRFTSRFFVRLAEGNVNIWLNFSSFIIDKEDWNAFIVCLFKYVDEESLVNLNGPEELDFMLSNQPDFVSFLDKVGDFASISNYFMEKGLKIKLMPSKAESERLFEFFFENDLYMINRGNIATILLATEVIYDSESYTKAPYTNLLSSSAIRLKEYVEANFQSYVLNVLFVHEQGVFYEESQEVLIKILNRSDIDVRLKTSFLQKQSGEIVDLSMIDDEAIWPMIVRTYKLELNLRNLLLFYDYSNRNPEQRDRNEIAIVDFIVQQRNQFGNNFVLNQDVIDKNQELYNQFLNFLVYSKLIDFDIYKSVMIFVNMPLAEVRCNELSKEKLKVLIENMLVAINPVNFKSILDFDNELMLLFVKLAIVTDQFGEISDEIEGSEWLSILSAKSINDDNKKSIVHLVDDKVLLVSSALNELVMGYLVLNGEDKLSYEKLRIFLIDGRFSFDKLKLILLNLSNLSEQEIRVCVGLLGVDYQRIFQSRNRPVFNNDAWHEELFIKLLDRDMIIGFKLEGNQIRVSAKV